MRRAQRHAVGSVRLDKRRKTWNYLWYENGKRRSKLIGTKREYPTKGAAWSAAESLMSIMERQQKVGHGLTVRAVVDRYREEKMPKRADTRRAYEVRLSNHILPTWGDWSLQDMQARPSSCGLELWRLRQRVRRISGAF